MSSERTGWYAWRPGNGRALWWIVMLLGFVVAAWPESQALYGAWNQRKLSAAFDQERDRARQDTTETAGASNNDSPAPSVAPESQAGTSPAADSAATVSPASWKKSARERNAKTRKHHSNSRMRPASRKWHPTRIRIPEIDLDAFVVQGIGKRELRCGPGHDPATALPGQQGNCVIAAHRNAYGWWFRRLDELNPGDLIYLETPRESFTYKVAVHRVAHDGDFSVLAPPPSTEAAPRLTLYSCTLPKSDRRLVIVANRIS
jgi:LPXTG-site transpeptidase (sortase) family protein